MSRRWVQYHWGFLLPEQRLARLLGGQGVWGIAVTVVLGGLQRDGFPLLGTLLLARERSLVLVRNQHVLDCRYQSIQLLGRRFRGGRFRLLRNDPKECRM